MVSHTRCPLCQSDRIEPHIICTDYLVTLEEFELWKCRDCGFVFTREYPDENSIGKYYESDDYISHDDRAKGTLNRVYQAVRGIMLQRKARLVIDMTGIRKGSILDIGSGTGYFAATMKNAGWDVTGIEPNEKARNLANIKFGLNVLQSGKINELRDESFDCISMWHVMEHFHDPFKYADEIDRLLKPEGFCIAALPNNDSYDAKHYGKYWAAWDVPRHLWHFNPSTFKTFWDKKGFVIELIRGLPFDVFYISMLSEKHKGSRAPFIKGLLKGSWFAIKTAVDINKSSSLIYFIHK
jgi:SAM-dependent methyltransferase